MTAEQRRHAAEVIEQFRKQLGKLHDVEKTMVAPLTQRVLKMVDSRRSTRPPAFEEEGVTP
jgi:hypothetical protein